MSGILDSFSLTDIFGEYVSESESFYVVKRIVKSANKQMPDEEADEISQKLISGILERDFVNIDFVQYDRLRPTYKGLTSTEIINNFFDDLNGMGNKAERLFFLHQMYFGLNFNKYKTLDRTTDSVQALFEQYYSENKNNPKLTECFLKSEIRKTLSSYGLSPRSAKKLLKAAKKGNVLDASGRMSEKAERLLCIVAAKAYNEVSAELTVEEFASDAALNLEDIKNLSNALEKGRVVRKILDVFAIAFIIFAIIIWIMTITESPLAFEAIEFIEGSAECAGIGLIMYAAELVSCISGLVFGIISVPLGGLYAKYTYLKYEKQKDSPAFINSYISEDLLLSEIYNCSDEEQEDDEDEEEPA